MVISIQTKQIRVQDYEKTYSKITNAWQNYTKKLRIVFGLVMSNPKLIHFFCVNFGTSFFPILTYKIHVVLLVVLSYHDSCCHL